MYELTTDGLFNQIKAIESAIDRTLNNEELDSIYFVRNHICCVGLDFIFKIEQGRAEILEFFELPTDVQDDLICKFGVEL